LSVTVTVTVSVIVTVGVVEVGVVDTRYGVNQPGATLSGRGARWLAGRGDGYPHNTDVEWGLSSLRRIALTAKLFTLIMPRKNLLSRSSNFSNNNKTIVDITLRPLCCPLVSRFEYTSYWRCICLGDYGQI